MIKFEFIEKENILTIIPLLHRLNQNISEEILEERLNEMMQQNYQCIGVFDDEKLIGICGIWILVKYYVGKHIELDNIIILPEYQNKNIGTRLMTWIELYAKENNCVASELNCYVSNEDAHRFWRKEKYELIALHFQKKLS